MKKDACFELGHIVKAHGIDGDVLVFLDVDNAEDYLDLEAVYLETAQQLVPYLLDDVQLKGTRVIFKFEDIDTPEKANELAGIKLFLPIEALPPLKKGQYYLHDLVTFEVIDHVSGTIGTVKEIYNLPHQDLLGVMHPKGEVLVPINDDIIRKVDLENKQIHTQLPEGLLEIYTEES